MTTMPTAVAAVLLLARLYFGLGLASHGCEKLFGWFGGHGIRGTGQGFEMLGFRPGALFALCAGLGEFGGGLLTALGLLNPIGPALMLVIMLVAILAVNLRNGFQTAKNGFELPGMYAMGALVIAFTGPGPYSLDGLIGIGLLLSPTQATISAVVLALLNLVIRRPRPATS